MSSTCDEGTHDDEEDGGDDEDDDDKDDRVDMRSYGRLCMVAITTPFPPLYPLTFLPKLNP